MIKAIIGKEHYETKITGTTYGIAADESIANGGTGKGFTPSELLASSLASCVAITIRMYADRKSWELDGVEVRVRLEKTDGQLVFIKEILFLGNLSEEQKARLIQIAAHCPVSKILSESNVVKMSIL